MTVPRPHATTLALQALAQADTPRQPLAVPWAPALAAGARNTPTPDPAPPSGSQRRKLWQLPVHAHCPVVGVCLPIEALRQVVDRVAGGTTLADDYALHCGVNAECRQRNRLSEALQSSLERRYAAAVRESASLKDRDALAVWWQQMSRSGRSVAGALWAVLTHPRCDLPLEERVLQDIHMRQHQAGAADRIDQTRLAALQAEHLRMTQELAALQQRQTRQAQQQARQLEEAQAALMRARADLIGRDTVIASLWEELRRLESAQPSLRRRDELTERVRQQHGRIQALEVQLQRAQLALASAQAIPGPRDLDAEREPDPCAESSTDDRATAFPRHAPMHALSNQAVLCVGGRTGNVPAYRALVEDAGGRFLHHDGGDQDGPLRLDQTLAAADLVICQTGCISHDAYWRVKAHCKRTGKRCVFVDTPSSSSLRRALTAQEAPIHLAAPKRP